MHRTLLLCFIHGFQGGDNTFGGFPEHLRALISHALPNITVKAITYPKFETRGDLIECVSRFREWLQNKVIDIEVASGTPSPTIDPSVHVVLVGHSMGGIVAAETLLSIVGDEPIKPAAASSSTNTNTTASAAPPPSMGGTSNSTTTATSVPPKLPPKNSTTGTGSNPPSRPSTPGDTKSGAATPDFMFPYITGILAFDTPYLGISPGVIAYSAESQYQTASSAYNALSSAAGIFGLGSAASSSKKPQPQPTSRQLPVGPMAAKEALKASSDAAAAPAWQSWGRYAMFAGAAGAVLAGGAAAYMNRDTMKEGWGWVGSHLEFVGCLVRGEELKQRVGKIIALSKRRGIGFSDMFTVLGEGAGKTEGITVAGGWVEVGGSDGNKEARGRTFCSLPQQEEWKGYFEGTVNDKMAGEIQAHCAMFFPKDNPGYYDMSEKAKKKVVKWVDTAWYRGSTPKSSTTSKTGNSGEADDEPIVID